MIRDRGVVATVTKPIRNKLTIIPLHDRGEGQICNRNRKDYAAHVAFVSSSIGAACATLKREINSKRRTEIERIGGSTNTDVTWLPSGMMRIPDGVVISSALATIGASTNISSAVARVTVSLLPTSHPQNFSL